MAGSRAEESKKPGQRVDIGFTGIAREIGAAYMNESDSKFSEEVFDIINSTWRGYEEDLYCDAISVR